MNMKKYHYTPEMDKEIIETYKRLEGKSKTEIIAIKPLIKLAKKYGIPRSNISRHVMKLNIPRVYILEPHWSARELEILNSNAYKEAKIIQKRLECAGFKRSLNSISAKKCKLKVSYSYEGMSATQTAECLGIDERTVIKWITAGMLSAAKRGKNDKIFWVKSEDLKQLFIKYTSEINFSKIDKFWLVDILTDGACKTESTLLS